VDAFLWIWRSYGFVYNEVTMQMEDCYASKRNQYGPMVIHSRHRT
jgi:hypothetical protein